MADAHAAGRAGQSPVPGVQSHLFHQDWWLTASTGGQWSQVTVDQANQVIGRLPYVLQRRWGFRELRMPPLTHLLGPAVDEGRGKPETRLRTRLGIIRDLLGQLPHFDFFWQVCDDSPTNVLAFQECGFQVKPQCNFEIDCRAPLESIWEQMHFKTRGHIRRAERDYVVTPISDAATFQRFYLQNVRQTEGTRLVFDHFPAVLAACHTRDCGTVLAAHTQSGEPLAMVCLVWDQSRLYYLLATRSQGSTSTGAANLLVWAGIKQAHSRGLVFDFDGIIHSGQLRFFLGFGGELTSRLIVSHARPVYGAIRALRTRLHRTDNRRALPFT